MILTLKDFPPADTEFADESWQASPCGQTAKSDPLTRANFDAICDRLDDIDPNGYDWEIIRWPHWKCEWHEVIFVRPSTKCADLAHESRQMMAKYPCLNEDLWVEYEAGAEGEG